MQGEKQPKDIEIGIKRKKNKSASNWFKGIVSRDWGGDPASRRNGAPLRY
jgi:hypothetical protein